MLLWFLSLSLLLVGCMGSVFSESPEVACPGMASVLDFELPASQTIERTAWGYYSGGAMMEQTLRDNLDAFKRYRFRPRVLRDVSSRNLSVTILGSNLSMPIGISPSALQMLAHPEGENGTVAAAAEAGTVMVLSTQSTISLEEVAAVSPNSTLWFQLYAVEDREVTRDLVQRADKAGYKAIVLTVDSPIRGIRWTDMRNKFNLPKNLTYANLEAYKNKSGFHGIVRQHHPTLTWNDIHWLKNITALPIVAKGILTGEDAKLAVEHGVSAIIVSNHGGRQLDGAPATLDVLPEVVKAVEGKCEVYMDGGIRTGTDVLKALALGAKAVFYGRPNLWGLAYGGKTGSKCVLDILRDELDNAMAQIGYTEIDDITQELVIKDSYYTQYREM